MATGLARITISTPHRRLDVAVPDHAPVAELLPELERHAGAAAGDWVLRRPDGPALSPARGLADQGIVDGAVLHLAPARLDWPPPAYDDPAEAVADGARDRGPPWSVAITRATVGVLAALVLAGGLAVTAHRAGTMPPAVPALIAAGALLAGLRTAGRVVPALAAGAALSYAYAAGALWAPGDAPAAGGAVALLAVSLVGTTAGAVPAAGRGTSRERDPAPDGALDGWFVHVAGMVVGILGAPAALAAAVWPPVTVAAALACVLVCAPGALPLVAARFGGLPLPPAGTGEVSPAALGRQVTRAAVARADELLTGALCGWSVLAAVTIGVLLLTGGPSGQVLAGVTAAALALRARLFVAVRHRLPLLVAGLLGLGMLAVSLLAGAPAWLPPAVVAVAGGAALAAVLALDRAGPVAAAGPGGPRLARLADLADTLAIVSVVPVAATVLDLYPAARALLT